LLLALLLLAVAEDPELDWAPLMTVEVDTPFDGPSMIAYYSGETDELVPEMRRTGRKVDY